VALLIRFKAVDLFYQLATKFNVALRTISNWWNWCNRWVSIEILTKFLFKLNYPFDVMSCFTADFSFGKSAHVNALSIPACCAPTISASKSSPIIITFDELSAHCSFFFIFYYRMQSRKNIFVRLAFQNNSESRPLKTLINYQSFF